MTEQTPSADEDCVVRFKSIILKLIIPEVRVDFCARFTSLSFAEHFESCSEFRRRRTGQFIKVCLHNVDTSKIAAKL